MALSTPFTLINRGLGANTSVDKKYPHSVVVNQQPVRVATARFSGPDATTVKGAALATSDVFQMVQVPAGAFVLGVAFKVVTAEGGTCTFDIGDGTDTDGYFSGANGNTTTNSFSWDESPGTLATTEGVGHFYAAADTIDILLASGTAATVVADISVTYIMTAPQTQV